MKKALLLLAVALFGIRGTARADTIYDLSATIIESAGAATQTTDVTFSFTMGSSAGAGPYLDLSPIAYTSTGALGSYTGANDSLDGWVSSGIGEVAGMVFGGQELDAEVGVGYSGGQVYFGSEEYSCSGGCAVTFGLPAESNIAAIGTQTAYTIVDPPDPSTATPEPATAVLFALGCVFLLIGRKP